MNTNQNPRKRKTAIPTYSCWKGSDYMFDVKKETPPKRSYIEVMNGFQKAQTPKEYRAIHKELKRDYKDGIPIWYRYPYLSLWISIIGLAISCFTLLMRLLK